MEIRGEKWAPRVPRFKLRSNAGSLEPTRISDFLLATTVTVGLFCTVYEINGDFGRKSQIFPPPCI